MFAAIDKKAPGPAYMSEEQKGQHSLMSSYSPSPYPSKPSGLRQCFPVEDAGSQDIPTAQYLRDLRKPQTARPTGSRPPPPSKFPSVRRAGKQAIAPEQAEDGRPTLQSSNSMPLLPAHRSHHQRIDSTSSPRTAFAGRPLARPLVAKAPAEEASSPTNTPSTQQRTPSVTYMERGTRWMEKQEVKSLRMALADMDMDAEKRIHDAAQDEAAELVWKHKNPDAAHANPHAPYPNPDTPRDYRSHLRKGSYSRTHSQDAAPVIAQSAASGGSHHESEKLSTSIKRRSVEALRKISPPLAAIASKKARTPSGKSFGGLAEAVADDIAKAHRRTSSGSKRLLSGDKKMFMHPNDRIYEDPEEGAVPKVADESRKSAVPSYTRRNPFARVRAHAEKLERSQSEPIVTIPLRHSVEIQRNPPSQLKKPWYMSNQPLTPTPPRSREGTDDEVSPKVTPTRDSMEIRGDEIRAATSKQRKDYSPKLPRPTMVSDKPGRPIVSFRLDHQSNEIVLEEMRAPAAPRAGSDVAKAGHQETSQPNHNVPRISIDSTTKPPIPIINLPDETMIPSIVLPEEPDLGHAGSRSAPITPMISVEAPKTNVQAPAIAISGTEDNRPAKRPLPPTGRPLPLHASTSPIPSSRQHYTPSIRQSGALCAHCALPIAGRILSAGGERFHPSCFVCHQCNTNLELVAFYPEPEKEHLGRLQRIAARQAGLDIEIQEGMTEDDMLQQEAADGDESLRFFCHLDFHELFSPRGKSCKTPIEGEVIMACGAEWHVGHFFCAQCGDPFDSTMPFVEKDGYAWCVGCHTNRYSPKCRKCKKPVTDTVVKALGYDWHGQCFVCTLCSSEFEDGKYFLRDESQDPVCVKCEERRLKT